MTREEFGKLLGMETDLIPKGKRNRSGMSLKVEYITIHNTSNDRLGADARAHAKFVSNVGFYEVTVKGVKKRQWVSWHYTVDDKRIVKHLPDKERGIHAQAGNSNSLGIEICMNKGIDQEKAFLRAARLTASLLYDYKMDITKVVPHRHWTKKNCPILLLNGGNPGVKWNAFKELIAKEMKRIG